MFCYSVQKTVIMLLSNFKGYFLLLCEKYVFVSDVTLLHSSLADEKHTHTVISYSQPCEKRKAHTSTTPQAALKVGRGKVVL
jgi:hypothetical protein